MSTGAGANAKQAFGCKEENKNMRSDVLFTLETLMPVRVCV